MNFTTITQSKHFTKILYGLGIFVAVLVVFQAGVFVGFHKARFSFGNSERYNGAYGERRHGGFGFEGVKGMMGGDLQESHGAAGRIIKVQLPMLIVEGPDHVERIIRLDDETEIRKFREEGTKSDLIVGQYVVVIGTPNSQAEVVARLIRLLPPPSAGMMQMVGSTTQATTTLPIVSTR